MNGPALHETERETEAREGKGLVQDNATTKTFEMFSNIKKVLSSRHPCPLCHPPLTPNEQELPRLQDLPSLSWVQESQKLD